MRGRRFHLACAMVALVLAPLTVRAQGRPDEQDLSRDPKNGWEARQSAWYATLRLGAGQLAASSNELPGNDGIKFAYGVGVGLNVTTAVRVGIEYGGMITRGNSNLNSYAVDTSRTGITQTFVVTQWYPRVRDNWFIRAGGGLVDFSDPQLAASSSAGIGYTAGIGWDAPAASTVRFSVLLAYNWGTLNEVRTATVTSTNRRYHAPELRVGITWH